MISVFGMVMYRFFVQENENVFLVVVMRELNLEEPKNWDNFLFAFISIVLSDQENKEYKFAENHNSIQNDGESDIGMNISSEIRCGVPVRFDSNQVPNDINGYADSHKSQPNPQNEPTEVSRDHIEDDEQ